MKRQKKQFKLSERSKEKLEGLDPRLVALVDEILWYMDVSVIEGIRSVTQQQENIRTYSSVMQPELRQHQADFPICITILQIFMKHVTCQV